MTHSLPSPLSPPLPISYEQPNRGAIAPGQLGLARLGPSYPNFQSSARTRGKMAGVWAVGWFSALKSRSHWLRCHQPLQELVHWHALIATFRHDQGLQDCHTECWLSWRLFSRDRVDNPFGQSHAVLRNSWLELKTRAPSMSFEHSEIRPKAVVNGE
jgi:hypothetical protein